ncbi:MAG: hypothetical protein GC204_09330 [Chloroflexi bacterium]|nr:hypothetical protein [Chloroflexota bacterium]
MDEEPPEERFRYRSKTVVTQQILDEIDSHYRGGLTAWKGRHRPTMIRDKKNIKFFDIAATQLYSTFKSGHLGALNILDQVIACTAANRCHQILCPECRSAAQKNAADKAIKAFSGSPKDELRFLTLLMQVDADATMIAPAIREFRQTLSRSLHNNIATLGADFKMLGAFEVDIKNLGTQLDASPESRALIEHLGFRPKPYRQQYLLHYHAIVSGINEETEERLTKLLSHALGVKLVQNQLRYECLYNHLPQDDSLINLASYMFKARLQFSDNIFFDRKMKKQARYHTPYKGKVLVDYLEAVNAMQNFKGLKFDFGINDSRFVRELLASLKESRR